MLNCLNKDLIFFFVEKNFYYHKIKNNQILKKEFLQIINEF